LDTLSIIAGLKLPAAYPHEVSAPVELHETHISLIFLAGDFAYKVKKPVTTDFLDYGTLEKRHHACLEELRLGVRYADDLYLAVVPITDQNGCAVIEGSGPIVEYAVKMRRFPSDALLGYQLHHNQVTRADMNAIAASVAAFHQRATRTCNHDDAMLREALNQAVLNFKLLHSDGLSALQPKVAELKQWTTDVFEGSIDRFRHRLQEGYVRECHGDLHCDNVVKWRGCWVPFDGIEFNAALSWIDVLDDASFLMVDLEAREQPQLARCFINAYLEQTGDYADLRLLRWYAAYRALVRAKVAMIRCGQLVAASAEFNEQLSTAKQRIELAYRFMQHERPTLLITQGLSGSGKTTGSETLVAETGAIRIRSDVERKRLFGMSPTDRQQQASADSIYSRNASVQTYARLLENAKGILQAGYSVVVDATFLKLADRTRFHQLAIEQNVRFRILSFEADEQTLRQRIVARQATGKDASDADIAVLEQQLAAFEPLTDDELLLTERASHQRLL
jgi:uncharacterized protein